VSYEVFLYSTDPVEPYTVETCGHGHATLEDAWACARTFDAENPFDVVFIHNDVVMYVCWSEDETP
jgi:hypothetical protein